MYRAILTCLALALILTACTKDHASDQACQSCSVISFRGDIIPIFRVSCALSGCHTGTSHAGGVDLDSAAAYAQATHPGTGYVTAGSPNTSVLYSQLLAGFPNHMPVGGQLDPCDVQKIYCWIEQGALNN